MHNRIPIILKLIMDPGRTFATTDGSSRGLVQNEWIIVTNECLDASRADRTGIAE